MASLVALFITGVFSFWLFRRDMQLRRMPSGALWIPAIWLTILASRSVGYWLGVLGIYRESGTTIEGSPVDMAVFLILIVSAILVLFQRPSSWMTFARDNKLLLLMYLYLALSSLWSEYPEATFKRAFKDFGHVLVALVFLSESDPLNAIRIVYVRISYLLFPLSVTFIKYFPNIGRVPDRSGDSMFTGVTGHKNSLGNTVFVLGLFLFIDVLEMRERKAEIPKTDLWVRYSLLVMAGWLLITCNSFTSMISLTLSSALVWYLGRILLRSDPKRVLYRGLTLVGVLGAIEYFFDVTSLISEEFGRGSGFSGRTEIWEMVRQTHTDPLIGCGFYSFWSTTAALEISALFKGTLATVHNGLLEMYLDCGAIGLSLLVLLLLLWGRRAIQLMLGGSFRGQLTLCIFVLTVMNNFSETHYFRFTPLWFTFLVFMIAYKPNSQALPQYDHAPGDSSHPYSVSRH